VNQLLRRSTPIKDTRITLLEDHHAASFDSFVRRVHCCGDEVRKVHMVMNRPRLSTWRIGSLPSSHFAMRTCRRASSRLRPRRAGARSG